MIRIYNTLTRKKEEFKPILEGKVKMYVCGPTVYNFIHLGNARPLVVFDTVRRYLEYKGYEVTYVQNFTDVDDKIINKAKESGKEAKEISEKFIEEFFRDAEALGVKKADFHPKVTENMDDIIDFIKRLIDKDMAYVVDGDVYFKTEKFSDYGKLSNQSIEDLKVGVRIEVDEKKKNPLDFALWKNAKMGEVNWNSPFGQGRPGWHIECSTMSKKYLGETIDIHAGGADLIFPHHENEIAQSESLTNKPFAKYWMHNGYININNEKMSKSLGNVLMVRELISKYDPNILRFLILSVHYRNPINFSEELLEQSSNSLERIKKAHANMLYRLENLDYELKMETEMSQVLNKLSERFEQEMDDDFNTANAITVIFDLIKQSNIYLQKERVSSQTISAMIDLLRTFLNILGLDKILRKERTNTEDAWVEELIEERNMAKKNKNWARADEIRDYLKEHGIILEDTPQGVRWRRR
ncbi:cysteine--tRNA ligase [Vulcanibacillus modesticaldus]|uniref:Cysteine--tRNA ligase n=1 Tax=Vulcanibacillus modesticaldus TaxID=337097 RepID=A0A1D2YRZ6_9BACI|nr:cysteine--tRNA ligase [Vulcanibacillus modesticaldus]OEF96397.1 cysteine--tRNA ligase [Vulcanibacillus modesticaldus]